MSRAAVFIDAGYFWVQTTHVLTGERGSRASVLIDYAALHKKVLDEVTAQFPGKDLLRVFWYDGPDAGGAKGPDHIAIADSMISSCAWVAGMAWGSKRLLTG